MEEQSLELAKNLVDSAYIEQGRQALRRREGLVKSLLSERRLPKSGFDDASIEQLLHDFALMDSNNFLGNVGVGEREGRVYSTMVAQRHYRMSHGIGRSGGKRLCCRISLANADLNLTLSSSLVLLITNPPRHSRSSTQSGRIIIDGTI